MRLIDVDALGIGKAKREVFNNPNYADGWNSVIDLINNAPTVDAVEVVRCKDCKHRDTENGFCEGRGWPMQLVPDDGFCDKGKSGVSWEWRAERSDNERTD